MCGLNSLSIHQSQKAKWLTTQSLWNFPGSSMWLMQHSLGNLIDSFWKSLIDIQNAFALREHDAGWAAMKTAQQGKQTEFAFPQDL